MTEPDTAPGTRLIEIHDWLRDELDRLREELDAYLDGDADRPRDLRTHCSLFCDALTLHHGGEDAAVFPLLAELRPELRPALDQLARDHVIVADLLAELRTLVTNLPERPGEDEARRVRGELEGLSAVLESHLTFEERRLVDAMNAALPVGVLP
jgi:hemerythrin-like domain-containing protein